MEVKLIKAKRCDADVLIDMQIQAFTPLYEKYHDYKISPARETKYDILANMVTPGNSYYFITVDSAVVGALRIIELDPTVCSLELAYILPKFQRKCYAKEAITFVEKLYSNVKTWHIDAVAQEESNALYEQLGYVKTDKVMRVNDDMSLVRYEKHIGK